MKQRSGPLQGVKIVEFAGIGPVPYGATMLADLGAEIIRIDRPGGYPKVGEGLDFSKMDASSVCHRSRNLLRLDLKSSADREAAFRLISQADGLIEGYRPGTMEKLGLGPEDCAERNPRLVYVRVTGWGQKGPMSQMAGHDMNYLGLSGALSLFGQEGQLPNGIPPLVGDMAGGALFSIVGMLAGIIEARQSGQGQVVDASIVDGSANLFALFSGLKSIGQHSQSPGNNMLDGGRHYYRTYACGDGRHIVVGAIEPAFRKLLLEKLDLTDDPNLSAPNSGNELLCAKRLEEVFAQKPRDHWVQLFHLTDGCVTPVLSLDEAAQAAPNEDRNVFSEIDGVIQPMPAPRFSRTPANVSLTAMEGSRSDPCALAGWGFSNVEIESLKSRADRN